MRRPDQGTGRHRLAAGLLPALALLSCVAEANSRPAPPPHCQLPRAAWSDEIVRVRAAAVRECMDNKVLRARDAQAAISTTAQDQFWALKKQHDQLLRDTR